MAEIIPLFPLKLVVFPTEQLNLHIFEPKYKQLIKDCYEQNLSFGIPPVFNNKVSDYGTLLNLMEISKQYDEGEMDIKTLGAKRFKILELYKNAPDEKLYAAAKVEYISENLNGRKVFYKLLLSKVKDLFSILKINKTLPQKGEEFTTYRLAHYVGFSLEQEYDFLKIPDELSRQEFMLSHLEQMIPMVREMERLRKLAAMNGHFKDIIPPDIV